MAAMIDNIDRKILNELQTDAAQSVDEVSEKVALSRNACWRRIRKLESDGIIERRVALVNAEKVGVGQSVIVLIRTREHESGWLEKFERTVRDMPEILGAHRMSGDLDYVLRVQVDSVKGYDAFYKRLITRVPLADISASFVMEDIKNSTVIPV